jgi:hypothetical protein
MGSALAQTLHSRAALGKSTAALHWGRAQPRCTGEEHSRDALGKCSGATHRRCTLALHNCSAEWCRRRVPTHHPAIACMHAGAAGVCGGEDGLPGRRGAGVDVRGIPGPPGAFQGRCGGGRQARAACRDSGDRGHLDLRHRERSPEAQGVSRSHAHALAVPVGRHMPAAGARAGQRAARCGAAAAHSCVRACRTRPSRTSRGCC